MFSHIPEDVYCPQINGDVEDALSVLNVKFGGVESKTKNFDLELSRMDPENPITQVSKTPSDEEFSYDWQDAFTDQEIDVHDFEKSPLQSLSQNKMNEKDNASVEIPDDVEKQKEHELGEVQKEIRPSESRKTDDAEEKNADAQKPKENEPEVNDKKQDAKEVDEVEVVQKEPKSRENFQKEVHLEQEDVKGKEETQVKRSKVLTFPKKPKAVIKSELLVKDVTKFITEMKKKVKEEDLDLRLIPSNDACRFELPVDMTRLKDESPLSYAMKYCQITQTRKSIYAEKYEKHTKEIGQKSISVMELQKIYENIFHEPVLSDEILHLRRLLELQLSMELDEETFIIVSCLMERIILKSQGRGPAQGYKKNPFEAIDFCALEAKLYCIELSPGMHDLLQYIRGAS